MNRFFQKVDASGECWEWTAHTNNDGYGMFWFEGRNIGAHRMSWMLEHGETPDDWVLHKCGNRKCVNPKHLYRGSPLDNARDCTRDGNQCGGRQKKITLEGAYEIRRLRAQGVKQQDLADMFDVRQGHIANICTGGRRMVK